jgi:hypothetical protein
LIAPSPVRMMYFWNTKKMIATGMVIASAAASWSGYCEPAPSWPLTRRPTPVVSVSSDGDECATRIMEKLFHDPWNDKIISVIRAGRAMGRTTDQYVRKMPAPSIFAASSMPGGTVRKNCRMMNTPAASVTSGRIIPG